MRKHFFKLIIPIFAFALLLSCDKNRVYDQVIEVDDVGWNENKVFKYYFDIKDTAESYNILYTVRYTPEYPYYNLYVKYFIADSAGNSIEQKLQGMDLFDPKTGQPLGSGLGDIYDYQILSQKNFHFPHPGKYTLKVKQYMRKSPLPGINDFGVRIVKKSNPPS